MIKVTAVTSCSIALVLTFACLSACPSLAGEHDPPGFVRVDTSRLMGSPDDHVFGVELAFANLKFEWPVDITNAGDGSNRLFVVEQDGRVRVWRNEPAVKDASLFLDITKEVRREHNEEGLLGLAFHPKFAENHEFFVFYSVTPRGSVISRFRVSKDDPNRADRASEEKLLEFAKPYGNHNGGCLKFGPDGMLYISVGDGGLANDPHENGQNLETVQGSVLRIDVDHKSNGKNYAIPADNPFVGRKPKVCEEIWAYGLRNPWRMHFDRQTGTLWAGDVGQDRAEEVDVIVRGGNYGWNLKEGKRPRDPEAIRDSGEDFVAPVFEYPRAEGKSITGGFVYRGTRLPSLVGKYVYADFLSGNIWALSKADDTAPVNHKVARTSLLISAFGEDEAGELYFTAFDGGVHRFRTPEKKLAQSFPRTLSETGLFSSVKEHRPAAGLIPYDVNVPLWSDGALKERFIALPENGSVVFDKQTQWKFPVGTVIVKTFSLPTDTTNAEKRRRLETRLWLHNARGWEGYTYLWNEDESDATLLADWPFTKEYEIKTPDGLVKQQWYFPSRSDCHACHTNNAGHVLGLNTRQLNRLHFSDRGGENQIEKFKRLELFVDRLKEPAKQLEAFPDWEAQEGKTAILARAYLDVNCALCHSPGGFGNGGGSPADLRYHNSFETAFAGKSGANPDAKPWIQPGQPQHSHLIQRMKSRHAKDQMPPLATLQADTQALKVLQQWIEQMDDE